MTLSNRSQSSSNGDEGGMRNGEYKYSTNTSETGHLSPVASVDNQDERARLSLVSSKASDVALVRSYRRPSFTYGQSRPSFVPSSPILTAIDALPTSERETMLIQEEELLHDNRFSLGPRDYGATSRRESHASSSTSGDVPNETTSLLKANSQWESAVEAGAIHTTYLRELIVVTKSALPLWVTFVLQYSLTLSSVFAAGNLGKDELAGVSLGSMTATITGYAVYQGLTTALDTLCSQAYGAGNRTLVGLHLQRMAYFLMVISVPIMLLWFFSESLLNVIVPEPELAAFAGLYLRILALGAPGYALFEAGKRFAQAQGIFMASTYVLLISAPLNAALNYLLVWHPTIGVGYIGAPIAVVIVDWLMPTLLFLYIRFIKGSECWGGFSKKGFTNWAPMIKLAIPGLIMLEAEWLAFEIMTLLASYFSTAHVAAQAVLSTTGSLTFQLPFAVSVAFSTRLANFLGATLGDAAKTTAKLGILVSVGVGLFNFCLVVLIRNHVVRWFSDDPEVIALYLKTIPLAAALQFSDAVGAVTAGMLRGQGRQHLGSYINLTAYYAIAMPISIVAAFVFHWELLGLWFGVTLALVLIAILESYIILTTDWDQVVNEAKERIIVSH